MAAAVQTAPLPAHELVYESQQLPRLRSNYGSYLDPDTVGWMQETPIDTPMEEMRRRFDEDGYIFVKNVMPREDVLDMREAYFSHLEPTGILKPGTSPRDGIFNDQGDPALHNGVGGSNLPEAVEQVNKLTSAHTLPFYLAFLEHTKLRSFIREFMGWEKDVLIKRTMLRYCACLQSSGFDLLTRCRKDTTSPMASRQGYITTVYFCELAKPSFSPLGFQSETAQPSAVA